MYETVAHFMFVVWVCAYFVTSMEDVVPLLSELICLLPGKEACQAVSATVDVYTGTKRFLKVQGEGGEGRGGEGGGGGGGREGGGGGGREGGGGGGGRERERERERERLTD